jgi:hypothetical protein
MPSKQRSLLLVVGNVTSRQYAAARSELRQQNPEIFRLTEEEWLMRGIFAPLKRADFDQISARIDDESIDKTARRLIEAAWLPIAHDSSYFVPIKRILADVERQYCTQDQACVQYVLRHHIEVGQARIVGVVVPEHLFEIPNNHALFTSYWLWYMRRRDHVPCTFFILRPEGNSPRLIHWDDEEEIRIFLGNDQEDHHNPV